MYEEIITKIKELGMDDNQSEELFNNIAEEIADLMFQELAETSTDQELEELKQRMENSKSTDHYESILKEIAVTVYGDNATDELKQMFLDYIAELKDVIAQSKDLMDRYNQGDPEAVKLIQTAQQTDTYKNIMDDQNQTQV